MQNGEFYLMQNGLVVQIDDKNLTESSISMVFVKTSTDCVAEVLRSGSTSANFDFQKKEIQTSQSNFRFLAVSRHLKKIQEVQNVQG